jgi:hypothetical protein
MADTFAVELGVYERGRKKPEFTLDTDINGEVTLADLLAWTKQALIVTADTILREEQDLGFDKEPIVVVDGRRGKPPAAVHPLGSIEFTSRVTFGPILLEAYNGLLDRSKVLTGRYKASHYVFHNGIQVATDLSSLTTWLNSNPTFKDKDTVRIVNIQPYARRLERLGVTAQRSKPRTEDKGRRKKQVTGILVKIPNGAYQLTTRSIKAKYKQNAIIRFTFLPGSSLGLSGSFKGGRKGRNSAGRPYLYPSIVFDIQERGIL